MVLNSFNYIVLHKLKKIMLQSLLFSDVAINDPFVGPNLLHGYHNDPKFSDRQAWAKSVDPNQTAP